MSELTTGLLPFAATLSDHGRVAHVLLAGKADRVHLFEHPLEAEGYAVMTAADDAAAVQAVEEQRPDVVLVDVSLPGMGGVEVCRRLKRDPATRLTPVMLITGAESSALRVEACAAGADDVLSTPPDPTALVTRIAAAVRLKRFTDDLDSAASIVITLATMIEARDGHSEGHCHRMANYATALGRRLGLDGDSLQALQRGGMLHDIGMLAIPESVLRKSGPLNPDEFDIVKTHTTVGDSLCANLRSLTTVRPIVRHHHEKRDGSGYPDRLMGDEIPLLAQIIAIVDVFDAVTTRRAYQREKPVDQAIAVLRSEMHKGWRAHELVEEFVALIAEGRFGGLS